jgi:hypothetical protein
MEENQGAASITLTSEDLGIIEAVLAAITVQRDGYPRTLNGPRFVDETAPHARCRHPQAVGTTDRPSTSRPGTWAIPWRETGHEVAGNTLGPN